MKKVRAKKGAVIEPEVVTDPVMGTTETVDTEQPELTESTAVITRTKSRAEEY